MHNNATDTLIAWNASTMCVPIKKINIKDDDNLANNCLLNATIIVIVIVIIIIALQLAAEGLLQNVTAWQNKEDYNWLLKRMGS